jgi:tRNA 2-thiouridine synthesizing protein B
MLHIVNKSPFPVHQPAELVCAWPNLAAPCLLIEDGVFGATVRHQRRVHGAPGRWSHQVLRPAARRRCARGATGKVMDGVTLVDYSGFVDLTLEYSTSHSWL